MTDTGTRPPLDFPELEPDGRGTSVDEFANIPSARRRHPAVALVVAAFAGFLIYQVHDDFLFALSHSNSRDLGDVRHLTVTPAGEVPLNQYVRLTGMADRESGVIIDTQGSWKFTQFFRLLGTGSRVFVSRVADPIPVEQAERDVFVGRLVRFRDLSFQAAIRKHFAEHVSATHFFSPVKVREAVAAGSGSGPLLLTDMLGEKVSLAANDELALDVLRPDDVVVEMPLDKYPNPEAARAVVEQQGGRVLDERADHTDAKSLALLVQFAGDKRDQAMNAVGNLDPKIRFRPARATYTARMADVSADNDGLVLRIAGAAKHVPLAPIAAIRTLANVQIPDDALLLREGEQPRDHLKTLVVVAFLLGFAVVNLLALRSRG